MDSISSRRAFLGLVGAGLAGGLAGCRSRSAAGAALATAAAALGETSDVRPARMPVAFVGHGSPMLALDPTKGADLAHWSASLPRPRGIVVVSAHWEQSPATIGATTPGAPIYDFDGFPAELYRLRYPAPGAPDLAERVEALLLPVGDARRDPGRGLDHGAWVPLRWLYPRADVPVLPLSLPTHDPARLLALGRALAPLREEGVLVLCSGNLVHNLRRLGADDRAPTPEWASEFDLWVEEALRRGDLDGLADYARRAPAPDVAHPTKEHFVPILVAAGAAAVAPGPVSFPVKGFELGSVSRRCVQFG